MRHILLTASISFAVAGVALGVSAVTDKSLSNVETANRAALALLLPHVAVAPLAGAQRIAS